VNILSRAVSVHRGDRSLAESYWLWLVIPSAVVRALIVAVTYNSLSLILSGAFVYYIAVFGLQILFLAWLYYFGVGVLRSAKNAESSFWGGLAAVVVWLSFVVSPAIVGKNILDAIAGRESTQDLAVEIARLNAQLPKRIDSATTLEQASFSEKTIVYKDVIDQRAVANVKWALVEQSVLKNQCRTFAGSFATGTLTAVQDRYFSEAGSALFTVNVTPQTCAFSTAIASIKSGPSVSSNISAMNALLPKRVDSVTTLERVEFHDGELHYKYVVDDAAAPRVDLGKLRRILLETACPTFKANLADGSYASVSYDYRATSGSALGAIVFSKADCN
jgi:hypothetical protein